MAAKVYAPPESMAVPDFSTFFKDGKYDMAAHDKANAAYIEHLRAWAKSKWHSPLTGETFSVGVADGQAWYMVASLKPLRLLHLPINDAYRERWDERWTVQDVKDLVEGDRKMRDLFGRKG